MIACNNSEVYDSLYHLKKMSPGPSTAASPESVDSLLAKEFLTLAFKDRNAIHEEIHGVSCLTPEETPDSIHSSLEKLDYEISKIPVEDKTMYSLSQNRYGSKKSSEKGGSYVNDTDFRVKFIRILAFDSAKAARKLVTFLDVVVDLFGEYALQRPIRLSDFSEEELQVFRVGNLQLLPFRDRSGRRIIAGVEGLGLQFNTRLRFKILYYLLWTAAEDFETQSKGIVVIIWPVPHVAMEHFKQRDQDIQLQKKWLFGTPVRVAAFHFCVPANPFVNALRMLLVLTLNKVMRSRLKFHVGQAIELQYRVKSYGIPIDHIPLTGTGNVKTQNLRVWMKVRSALEYPTEESTGTIVECPGSNDVLFRPSKLIKGHPGNVKFHSLIEYYHEEGLGITAASKKIIADIIKGNGRILVWEKRGWWQVVTDPGQMKFKVSVSYRDYKKKNKGKTQIYKSSTYAFQEQNGIKRKRTEQTTTTSAMDTELISQPIIAEHEHLRFLKLW